MQRRKDKDSKGYSIYKAIWLNKNGLFIAEKEGYWGINQSWDKKYLWGIF